MKRIGIHSLICTAILISLVSFFPVPDKSLVEDVLGSTNEFRKSQRLPALVIREDMNAIAQKHSDDMAAGRVEFGHSGFENRGSQVRKMVNGTSRFAENVAYGPTSGKDVVNVWKKSPGHRRNMLGPYKYIGIGIARDRKGILYYTQVFVD
jgi:uncharacterized protein YkwD